MRSIDGFMHGRGNTAYLSPGKAPVDGARGISTIDCRAESGL
jgi:hypothetical protein